MDRMNKRSPIVDVPAWQSTLETDKPLKMFVERAEQGALDQILSALEQPFTVQAACMPDLHQGYALPIGSVAVAEGWVIPAWVGYDKGCGMCALLTNFDPLSVIAHGVQIFQRLYEEIPVGFAHNTVDSVWAAERDLPRSGIADELFAKNGLKQLGSLGGGNHFIEIGIDELRRVWFIVHSGSRGFGRDLAAYHMALASPDGRPTDGHHGFESSSVLGQEYITDLNFALEFALENRRQILKRVERVVQEFCAGDGVWDELINRNHNHAEHATTIRSVNGDRVLNGDFWIHRKGATHAEDGMMGVIPGNMRDGSFIVRGRGNPASICSSSHGAGRVLGRKEALREARKDESSMDKFTSTMSNVISLVSMETMEEAPHVYKDIFSVMGQQTDLVDTFAHVTPILNIKDGKGKDFGKSLDRAAITVQRLLASYAG